MSIITRRGSTSKRTLRKRDCLLRGQIDRGTLCRGTLWTGLQLLQRKPDDDDDSVNQNDSDGDDDGDLTCDSCSFILEKCSATPRTAWQVKNYQNYVWNQDADGTVMTVMKIGGILDNSDDAIISMQPNHTFQRNSMQHTSVWCNSTKPMQPSKNQSGVI